MSYWVTLRLSEEFLELRAKCACVMNMEFTYIFIKSISHRHAVTLAFPHLQCYTITRSISLSVFTAIKLLVTDVSLSVIQLTKETVEQLLTLLFVRSSRQFFIQSELHFSVPHVLTSSNIFIESGLKLKMI